MKVGFHWFVSKHCCLYRLLGMALSARDNGSATTALQCRWHDSTSGAPDISQGGQLCMGDSHAWNTGTMTAGPGWWFRDWLPDDMPHFHSIPFDSDWAVVYMRHNVDSCIHVVSLCIDNKHILNLNFEFFEFWYGQLVSALLAQACQSDIWPHARYMLVLWTFFAHPLNT